MVLQVRITFKSRRYSVEQPQRWRSVSYALDAVGGAARTNGFANSRKLLRRRDGRGLDRIRRENLHVPSASSRGCS
jgi:hypothetical protein